MKQLLTIFNKERKETQWTTLVVLAIGVLVPLFTELFSPESRSELNCGNFTVLTQWASIALWLNLTVLCAIAFTRERENHTLEILRRSVPSWRLAAFGKFGYAICSTLILAAFFVLEAFAIDAIFVKKGLINCVKATFEKTQWEIFSQVVVAFNLLQTFVWGIFWTGKVSRQAGSILLSVLCAVAGGFLYGYICKFAHIELYENFSCYAVYFAATSLILLCCARLPNRYGYSDFLLKRSDSQSTAFDAKEAKDEWDRFSETKPSRPFAALFKQSFTDASVLFQSPASFLYELAILWFVFILIRSVTTLETTFIGAINAVAVLFFFAFTSGLFSDARSGRSLVKERLTAGPKRYWFAGALAGTLIWAALIVTSTAFFKFVSGYDVNIASVFERYASPSCELDSIQQNLTDFWILALGLGLWVASLPLSRLVKGALSFVAVYIGAVSTNGFVRLYSILSQSDNIMETNVFAAIETAILVLFAAMFLVSSYRIVTQGMNFRRATFSIAAPAVVLAGAVAFMAHVQNLTYPEPAEDWFTPPQRASFDASVFPKTEAEYQEYVKNAKAEAENVKSEYLDEFDKYLTSKGAKLQDEIRNLLIAFELTKKRAAAPREAALAEERVYNILLKADSLNCPQPIQKSVIKLLEEIPALRPTPEETADNVYAFMCFGDISAIQSGTFASDRVLQTNRENDPEAFFAAVNSAAQVMPEITRLMLDPEKCEYDDAYHKNLQELLEGAKKNKTAYFSTFDCLIEMQKKRLVELETARQCALMTFASRSCYTQTDELYQANDLIVKGALKEVPRGVSTPDFEPLFTKHQYPSEFKAKSKVSPICDRQGVALKTPDGRECFASEYRGFAHITYPQPENTREVGVPPSLPAPLITNLFDRNGQALQTTTGSLFCAAEYHTLSAKGEPIFLTPDPCDADPPFPCEDKYVVKKYNDLPRYVDSDRRSTICRVRQVNLFNGVNSPAPLLEGVWLIRTYKQSSEAAPEGVGFFQFYEQPCDEKFVDAQGQEILDESGRPRYQRRRSIFVEPGSASITGFEYCIPLPEEFAEQADRLKVVRLEAVGGYRDITSLERSVRVANGCVYVKSPGYGILVRKLSDVFPEEKDPNSPPAIIFEPFSYYSGM